MPLLTARASGQRMVQAALTLGLVAVTSVSLDAQRRPEQLPRIMIPTFQSADRDLGLQAAEVLRNRLSTGSAARAIYVIPRADIHNNLQNSGYSVTEALAPAEARTLATLLRADEYVDGTVTRTPNGVRVDARLVLARDYTVTQVLPPAEASRLDNAMGLVAGTILEARRQADAERACNAALRRGDAAAAVREGERGVQQNARYNNMVRVCLAQAYVRRDAGTDTTATPVGEQTLQLVEEVLASDPRNITALRLAALGYRQQAGRLQEAGDAERAGQFEDRYVQTLTSLVAADPSDLRLQEQVVNELAASGRAAVAVPIIVDALENNPGDPRMLRTGWLVLLAAQDFERAIGVGEEMVRVDTAAATPDYFRRLGLAHLSLAQQRSRTGGDAATPRQRALAVFTRGTQRFPNDASLWTFYARAQRDAGQPQQAAEAARRAIAIDNDNDAHVELVQAYVAARMWDDATNAIRNARTAGVNTTLLSQVALQAGNNLYRAGQASRERSDYESAIRFLRLSNEMESSLDAQFLLGASAFSLGDVLTRQAQENRDCASARGAQEAFATARTNLVAGRSQYPEPASQLLDAIGQFTTPLQQMVRAYCR
jgi:tetratricopeptide (TPR) repeat protein